MNWVGVLLKLCLKECPFTKSDPASRVILLLPFLISFIVRLSYQFGKVLTVGILGGVGGFLSQNDTDFQVYILQGYVATSFLHADFQEDWNEIISSPIYARFKSSSHLFK